MRSIATHHSLTLSSLTLRSLTLAARMMLLCLAACLAPGLVFAEEPANDLVAHEWGTFTTVAGTDGGALEWRPLAGPSDLPRFVYGFGDATPDRVEADGLRFGEPCTACKHYRCYCGDKCHEQDGSRGCKRCKGCIRSTVRMETPVIYFYTAREQRVSVKVDFPKGRITEWYPKAKTVGTGIDWGQILLQPGTTPSLPREAGKSHYYPARETDAVPLRVCLLDGFKEHEKFLFYRGVGDFDLPLSASLKGETLEMVNTGAEAIPTRIVFQRRGDSVAFTTYGPLAPGEKKTWKTSGHMGDNWLKGIRAVLTKVLVAQGLFLKEARAMVKTWEDHWFEDGLRVFYIVPRVRTDAILPLTIEPRPKKLVRVLVGRVEVITPERKREIRDLVARLGSDSFEEREGAQEALIALGRFAEPVLNEVLAATKDPEVRDRIEAIVSR